MKYVSMISAAVLLAGCGWAEWPPPGYKSEYSNAKNHPSAGSPGNKTGYSSKGAAVRSAPLKGGGKVTVARGDSVYALSRRYGVSMRAIIIANRLEPPYSLNVGQHLEIPKVREHQVRRGETLNSIAHRYGLSQYELARNNRLQAPYRIQQGQALIITQAEVPSAASSQFSRQSEKSRQRPASRQSQVVRAEPLASNPAPSVKKTVQSSVKPSARPTPLPEAKPIHTASIDRFRRTRGFIWLLRGRIISGFGPKAKCLHNDGINISAPRGAPVRAAEGGIVAYSGNELRGFGNLLLVKHANGWVTAYAHNGKLLVKRGDRVGKGQIIARVGSTGAVSRPQLHFEIRRGKRPLNPKKYLRKAPASS